MLMDERSIELTVKRLQLQARAIAFKALSFMRHGWRQQAALAVMTKMLNDRRDLKPTYGSFVGWKQFLPRI
jgi:hypothetical protein